MDHLKSLIREVQDFPKPGINFFDITTLLKDPAGLKAIIDEELQKLRETPPTDREMQRVMNGQEAAFYSRMERVNGQARALNSYFASTGNSDYFNEDLARYRALSANDITAAVRRWLPADKRLEFSVLPAPKK